MFGLTKLRSLQADADVKLQYWLQPPSVVRFQSVFFLLFCELLSLLCVDFPIHSYSDCFHESLQTVFTDRLLVYGFLITKWPFVCWRGDVQKWNQAAEDRQEILVVLHLSTVWRFQCFYCDKRWTFYYISAAVSCKKPCWPFQRKYLGFRPSV